MCAGKTCCRVFNQGTSIGTIFHSSFLGSLLRLFSAMLRYEKDHQLSFTPTTGGGVKRLNIVVKTSANHPQAPIGIAPGLS